ncbi:MAG: UvrB/UvrC motif-containing protein, partial [Burkholderiales bacterium]|nr:UvrB/UvrC motif-containing protein [Burkholderiales bacterium]
RAIDETERRRAKQMAFNEANGITPKSVQKRIKDIIDGVYNEEDAQAARLQRKARMELEDMDEKALAKELKRVEKAMLDAAKNLEFEKAAQFRDQLHKLRERVFGAA